MCHTYAYLPLLTSMCVVNYNAREHVLVTAVRWTVAFHITRTIVQHKGKEKKKTCSCA